MGEPAGARPAPDRITVAVTTATNTAIGEIAARRGLGQTAVVNLAIPLVNRLDKWIDITSLPDADGPAGPEMAAMNVILAAVSPLDQPARQRVMAYFNDLFGTNARGET